MLTGDPHVSISQKLLIPGSTLRLIEMQSQLVSLPRTAPRTFERSSSPSESLRRAAESLPSGDSERVDPIYRIKTEEDDVVWGFERKSVGAAGVAAWTFERLPSDMLLLLKQVQTRAQSRIRRTIDRALFVEPSLQRAESAISSW